MLSVRFCLNGVVIKIDEHSLVFHANYDANRQSVDSICLRSLFGIWRMTPSCYRRQVASYNLQLLRDAQCQLTARLNQLSWDGNQH
ncbi:hypothetical protein GQ600_4319 [Phytophthora cactorum]|nr:hypothetical protein GQ600_4319 [Phytophthora cactorum]